MPVLFFSRHHHRFTNDPLRDPELSGTTVDRADPTLADDLRTRLWGYTVFLSGYPFGFERLLGIAKHAAGTPEKESWIDTPKKARAVQLEYVAFVVGYSLLAAAALARPSTWGASLWFYWILPHMVGAGHLRYYQTAEHRACKMGVGCAHTHARTHAHTHAHTHARTHARRRHARTHT